MPPTPQGAFRAGLPWALAALLAGVATQIGLAMAGLLSHPENLQAHRGLAPWVTGLAAVTLGVAAGARDRPAALWLGAVLALLLLQGTLIRSLGFLRVLHALDALLAFAVCLLLVRERLPFPRRSAA